MLSKAYAVNCFGLARGAQNTLYIQKKKERTKINHPWSHFLAIPNLPVQFCPFPVYPGWQSHKCDPLVLVQFAFSWQEWFPLHSSMSMKSQIKKKWDFEWININYRYKHFDFYQTAIGTQQLSNSQKPQFICSFLLLVVLWPYFSVKLLFLSSPCSYCIKHSTYEWTTLILPWKGVEHSW